MKCSCGIDRRYCVKCYPGKICCHNRNKTFCRSVFCNQDQVGLMIKNMVDHSKFNDEQSNRYSPEKHIDEVYLRKLFKMQQKCPYCHKTMSTFYNSRHMVTIQRKLNYVGHTKTNSILCCRQCNKGHKELEIYLCYYEMCLNPVNFYGSICDQHRKK